MRRALAIGGVLLAACFSEPAGAGSSGGEGTTGTTGTSSSGTGSTTGSVTSDTTNVDSSSSETGVVEGSSSESGGCNEGEVFCPCFPNGTCFDPLQCLEGVCASPDCGDGTLDPGEECDDGNSAPADGCSPACQEEQQCLVLLTGGEAALELSSVVVRDDGSLDVVGTGTAPGTFDPIQASSMQTEVMTSVGRFLYIADTASESIVMQEILPDGVPANTSSSVTAAAVMGLVRLPGPPALLVWSSDDPAMGQYRFGRHPIGPEGQVEAATDELELSFPIGGERLRVVIHPDNPVFYVATDPVLDTGAVQLAVISGFGPFNAEQPIPLEAFRGLRRLSMDRAATSLLLTGINSDMLAKNNETTCSVAVPLGSDDRPVVERQRFLCQGWRQVADVLEVRPGEFLTGSLANSGLSLAMLDSTIEDAGTIAPGYHLLRRAYENVFVVTTTQQVASFRFNDAGTLTEESSVMLQRGNAGFADSVHAGAMVPCPGAR